MRNDSMPRIETREIGDGELDGVSGGLGADVRVEAHLAGLRVHADVHVELLPGAHHRRHRM